jgi:nitroreductase
LPGPSSFAGARTFDYDAAFDRNLGWLTEGEQEALRGKTVAIAGMGGVGGIHLLTFARFGVGGFTIADFDRFDLPNFNRQAGAMMSTLDRPKLDVMAAMARDINPELRLRRFPDGVRPEDVDSFLDGADLFVDGFDFFAIDIRRRVFARAHERGIPAVTAAPIGMGTAWLAFVPNGLSFEQYFRLEGQPETEQFLRFLVGLTPRGLHRRYLMDPTRIDLAARRGPSTAAGCQLAAGVAAVAGVKLMLGRGDVRAAPFHHHFDAYTGQYAVSRLPMGNAGPSQRARLALARRMIARGAARPAAAAPAPQPEPAPASVLDRILNAARWAPSGDNEQPWHFERRGEESVLIRVNRRAEDNVYEYRDGEPLLLGGGMLLASLEIAASAHGRRMTWRYEGTDPLHRIGVTFVPDETVTMDPLYGALPLRSVDRRRYPTRKLTAAEKTALAAALGDGLELRWHESAGARWSIARLNAAATDIRLRARETFETHRRVIDWTRRFSPSGIPAGALGVSRATLSAMRWQMGDWARADRMNRLTGTGAASLQLDLLPGMASAAFFSIHAPGWDEAAPETVLAAGRSIQRFWLEATRLGLALQPALATVIFADLGQRETAFTADRALLAKAGALARSFRAVFATRPETVVFLGRIGQRPAEPPPARSVRRPLAELMRQPGEQPRDGGADQAASGSTGLGTETGETKPGDAKAGEAAGAEA